MAAGTKFKKWADALGKGANVATDQFKLVLSNTIPDYDNDDVLADAAEIASGNGYSAGGNAITTTSTTTAAGVMKLVLADLVITAAGGSIGPFRYLIIIDSTINKLVQAYDRGASITLLNGDSMTANFDPSTGVATLS